MTSTYGARLRRLEELRRQLLARLGESDDACLNRRPADGGWSAGQVLAHVIEAERKSLAYVRKKLQDPDAIPRRTLRHRLNGFVLSLAMKGPFKFEVPPVVGEPPESVDLDDLTRDWQEVRSGWREFVSTFPPELEDRAVYRHPVAGPLTLGDSLRFLITHLERHSRQIDTTLK